MPDPTTQSNYLSIVTQHVTLDWNVDFDRKVLSGSATHELLVRDIVVKEVIFDSGDLDISSVEVEGISVPFKLNERHPVMGSALHVPFVHPVPKGSKIKVRIAYTTSKDAIALQFLDKEQTQGKKFPYLFSQCQPIYARTLAPLQDTPSVKLTYTAKVSSVLPVLMSAVRQSPLSDGPAHDGKVIGSDMVTYTYNQPTAIPSYLIALACGNVRYRPFPKEKSKEWSSGIWAEPELIDSAYWEFSADTNRFLAEEERIVGTYRFGVYDLLVLPPSFPYGGMENSCLTFLTPTLLAGDRTLVDVVVHELTHSWFGNGVTHQSATHLWLNEGWTTYIERVLQEVLHSPAHRGFSFLIGYKAMQDALRQYEDRPKYQRLVIDFDVGEDPDDAYSSVPYEKGANFLLYLERLLGGLDVFLPYVRDYVNTFMGQSINTDIWKEHLYSYWRNSGDGSKVSLLDNIDWDAWFFGEGLTLPVEMEYDLTLAKHAYELAARWDASRVKDINSLNFKSNDLSDFDSNQKAVFLEKLQSYPALPPAHLTYLGNLYGLSETANSELRFRYYELALLDTSIPVSKSFASDAARWVVGDDGTGIIKGRMKFCRPVLRAAARADPETTTKIFIANRDSFHPIARRLIEKVRALHLQRFLA
ncbi:LAP2 [Sanghuangporus vaninii]